jgi:CRISP-associated protein Cas1
MKKNYYLFNPGRLSRRDNTLKFSAEAEAEQPPRYLPVEDIDSLYVFGAVDANSSLFNFLGQSNVAVHFFDYYKNYTGSFMPRDFLLSGRMLILQAGCYSSKKKRLELAQSFITGAAHNILRNIRYYDTRGKDLSWAIEPIEQHQKSIPASATVQELMGIEGNIRQRYYEAFNLIINTHAMPGRNRQPPLDIVNALVSFGNMMCYTECLRAIHQTQLNPTISYLHEPGERRFSLALDIAELFKPLLIDRSIFRLLNKRELQDKHFDINETGVLLKPEGKKIFVKAIEDRLGETIQHRSLGKKVSYRYLLRLECYKLQKHLLGIEPYKPFKIWW